MKIKLTHEELMIMINTLKEADQVSFNTVFERRLSSIILREFLDSLLKRMLSRKENSSVQLDDKTLLVLNHVLPQLFPDNPYAISVLTPIMNIINQRCLSIS